MPFVHKRMTIVCVLLMESQGLFSKMSCKTKIFRKKIILFSFCWAQTLLPDKFLQCHQFRRLLASVLSKMRPHFDINPTFVAWTFFKLKTMLLFCFGLSSSSSCMKSSSWLEASKLLSEDSIPFQLFPHDNDQLVHLWFSFGQKLIHCSALLEIFLLMSNRGQHHCS